MSSRVGTTNAWRLILLSLLLLLNPEPVLGAPVSPSTPNSTGRQRISLNASWRFSRFTTAPDSLSYTVLKPYMLPSGNDFITAGTKHSRPSSTAPGSSIAYV
jgi:beta-galactosidase